MDLYIDTHIKYHLWVAMNLLDLSMQKPCQQNNANFKLLSMVAGVHN